MRPSPASVAAAHLGGEPEGDNWVGGAGQVKRGRYGRPLAELFCTCGAVGFAVHPSPHGPLLVGYIRGRRPAVPGGPASLNVVWLDEAGSLTATCRCGTTTNIHEQHVRRLRDELAAAKGKVVRRPVHPRSDLAVMRRGKPPRVPEQSVAVAPGSVAEYMHAQQREWGTYTASRALSVGGVPAFRQGEPVPVSHVERGIVAADDVTLSAACRPHESRPTPYRP